MLNPLFYNFVLLALTTECVGSFVSHSVFRSVGNHGGASSTLLKNDLRNEIERKAQQRAYENRARGDGIGSAAAGAAFGLLLGGPFGECSITRHDDPIRISDILPENNF